MNLTSPTEIKALLASCSTSVSRSLGQNFLINPAVPARIAQECGAPEGSGILEIGPGIGVLTRELGARYPRVAAIELDRSLRPVLDQTLADLPGVTVVYGDVMKTDIPELCAEQFPGMPVSVCANLPYYITTPILMRLLESGQRFDNITVMVQREVAMRLCAAAGTAEYGAITAALRIFGEAERLFDVSPGSFYPAPKVTSTVVRIKLRRTRLAPDDGGRLQRVIAASFAQRRKTLVNSLSSALRISKEAASAAVAGAGLPEGIRGERLDIDDFIRLAEQLGSL